MKRFLSLLFLAALLPGSALFALDFMMSDGWSNPMTQPTPSSLENMTHEQRMKAFHDYVHHVISSLKAQGTTPEIVQVGNEISNGVFWWEPMFRGRGFFDDKTHVAKPVVEAFEAFAWPAVRPDGNPRIWDFEGDERP